jgi:hypothetical protein
MRQSKYSEEQKQKAIDMYGQGFKLEDIEKETGVERTLASKWGIGAGYPPRRNSKKNKELKCPECGHKNPPNSNFCNHCGCDIRTPEMILVKKVESLRGMFMTLPNRDSVTEADEITRELIAYLEGKVQK